MKITIIGTGYVGLVTGTCFAEMGNQVVCVDVDKEKIEKLKSGKTSIYEPGLEVLFEQNFQQGRLRFTTSLLEGIQKAEIIFLALPTPPTEDGSADLQYIIQVADDLGSLLSQYVLIVNKSTVPVGTTKKIREAVAKKTTAKFDMVSNPEFLREGVAVEDFMKPRRVIIGTRSEKIKKIMNKLYAPFLRQNNPIIFMDEISAELTKYAANSFLATKITFMNEIANLCEFFGADVDDVRKGIGSDTRIGKNFLFAGIGYGGSCFPKDIQALSKSSKNVHYDFKILEAVMEVNRTQKTKLIAEIVKHFNGDLLGKTIAIWGLAFKPYTDDIREAPALENITMLLKLGANVKVYDPQAMENARSVFDGSKVTYCRDQYVAIRKADALLIMTEWPVFRTPDFDRIISEMKEKVIFDGRNLFELEEMNEKGFKYISIGRPKINA